MIFEYVRPHFVVNMFLSSHDQHDNVWLHFKIEEKTSCESSFLAKRAMVLLAALSAKIREYVKSDFGPLQKWKHVQDLLVSDNVAYRTLAKADAFVVHEKNRSGTLINPYSMHSKGLQIIQTAADVSLLHSQCASNSALMPLERKIK